jgi:hypothetical protein
LRAGETLIFLFWGFPSVVGSVPSVQVLVPIRQVAVSGLVTHVGGSGLRAFPCGTEAGGFGVFDFCRCQQFCAEISLSILRKFCGEYYFAVKEPYSEIRLKISFSSLRRFE